VVVLRYAASGALGTFWYWYYEYNADIYMLPYRNTKLLDVLGVFVNENQWVVGCFFFSSLVSLARPGPGKAWSATPLARSSTTGLERTAASIAVVMFFAGVAPLRFWPHYFLCVFPFVALTVGLRAEDLLAGRAIGRTSAWAALLMLLLANSFLGAAVERRYGQFTNEARRGGWQSENREAVCGAIDAYSTANDSLFIWGFSGDLYLTCRRHPASRFTYLTLVAGIVPPNWSIVRDDEVAKNAREQLIEDLRKNRPSVVLDSPESMGKVSFEQIPMVREFIKHDYCLRDEKSTLHDGKVKIWVRRDLPACAQAPLADSI